MKIPHLAEENYRRTREIVLLHYRQEYPTKQQRWLRPGLLTAGLTLILLAIVVLKRETYSDLSSIESDLNFDIPEENFL